MSLKHILQMENPGAPLIYLHREENGWRAYEYSALRLCKDIHPPVGEMRGVLFEKQKIATVFITDEEVRKIIEEYPVAWIENYLLAIHTTTIGNVEVLSDWKEKIG